MSFAFFTDRKDTTNVNKSVPFYAVLNAKPAYWYINIYFTIDLANISNHSNSVKLTFCPYIPLPTVFNNSFPYLFPGGIKLQKFFMWQVQTCTCLVFNGLLNLFNLLEDGDEMTRHLQQLLYTHTIESFSYHNVRLCNSNWLMICLVMLIILIYFPIMVYFWNW